MRHTGELTPRSLRHPLSKAQIEVLKKLAVAPCYTSTSTMGVYVAGPAAAALRRRGLVKLVGDSYDPLVAITETGLKALKLAERGEVCSACEHEKTRHRRGIGECFAPTIQPGTHSLATVCKCTRYRRSVVK